MTQTWEVVIGLETHAQLNTRSKQFSGASTQFGAQPNTQACPVDLALPGSLPVMNRESVECAIKLGLAIGAKVARTSIFARKNYFYPDLPKGYQISQFETPVVDGGSISIVFEGKDGPVHKTVRLTRAHLEEDAGKSVHEGLVGSSGIDLNRAGTPLLEIVTEPDMRSAKEAVAYAKTLHGLVTWLDICDGNMQEGSFRCDANVSVRPLGQVEFGTRCEIKNLNSFRFLERAIDFEVRRQIELIEDGGRVVQETRLYDPDKDETRSMRSKEDAHDYRYFPDPDLPSLVISEDWIARVQAALPELPVAMAARFVDQYKLSVYDATALTSTQPSARYFETALTALAAGTEALPAAAKLVANWVNVDLAGQLNRDSISLPQSPVSAEQLAGLLRRIQDGSINSKIAKEVFVAMWVERSSAPDQADQIITSKGLTQISDSGAIEKIIDEVLAGQAAAVAEYRAGKEKAFNSLVGQIMKASRGKANPAQVNELLKQKLAG
jgi:aspartyl-tRNA(Asn)/glutamyl-tRNA(Gln) amidotransferase subunit B